jgi:hypothetical protein
MKLVGTDIVKREDERPARRDGTCFYCCQAIGAAHKLDCVIVSKSVVIRLSVDVVIDVPRTWGSETIEFAKNESSACIDGLLVTLGEWAAKDDHTPGTCACACGAASVEFLRDATPEDHAALPDLIDRDTL